MLVPVGKLGNPLIEQRGGKKKISNGEKNQKIKFDPDEKVSMERIWAGVRMWLQLYSEISDIMIIARFFLCFFGL